MSSAATKFRCIGRGFCGSVWALETSGSAIKREDGGPGRSLTNDYNMHLKVQCGALTYQQPSTPFSVPQCHQLIEAADPWWETRLPQFPAGYSACRALVSERIPKVPRAISDKIVDLFCEGNTRLCDFVKNNPDDSSCLIRPYLGRRRRHKQGASNSRFQRFSLRNVPLHVDQMEALGLDTKAYAETMADALALMYWVAKIDANDVEFVLAPPREEQSSEKPVFQSNYLGRHSMWILDFDCCRTMSTDEAGVEQACGAFFRNDPFYPRPGSKEEADQQLWKVFKERFIQASRGMLKIESEDKSFLADILISKIEEWKA
ncbi:calcineurin-like phosphoesterase [Curvularia clavata]|uniref:Calcineurin-like phosphoesterase n=1 Tax=Curvularia clavata TaxID=95742 RepID=A0A9Q8Z9Y6_CURCL|nr:calcineurin-like phosphoesterase [Curvularia clavata]